MSSCSECKFWDREGRASAPYAFPSGKQVWSRPCCRFPERVSRQPTDWCGEYAVA